MQVGQFPFAPLDPLSPLYHPALWRVLGKEVTKVCISGFFVPSMVWLGQDLETEAQESEVEVLMTSLSPSAGPRVT